MKIKKIISIVIGCFNEEENVEYAYKGIRKITDSNKQYEYEYIFVDNGSTDRTRDKMRILAEKDKRITGVFLSRNFGPEASLWAGIMNAKGGAIIPIECDLQSPPELIPEFIKYWEQGYDIVAGVYKKIEDYFLMTWIRKIFYRFFKAISNIDVPINASGFSLMDRKVIEAMKTMPEKYRFFRGLLFWVGFKKKFIPYERKKRERGISSYNFLGYVRHAERGVFGFSYFLLDVMVYFGFLLVLLSFLFIAIYLFMVLFIGNPINASIPIILAIVFFGGVQLLAISIIGKYIQVIVEETKNRPVYIVEEVVNKK